MINTPLNDEATDPMLTIQELDKLGKALRPATGPFGRVEATVPDSYQYSLINLYKMGRQSQADLLRILHNRGYPVTRQQVRGWIRRTGAMFGQDRK